MWGKKKSKDSETPKEGSDSAGTASSDASNAVATPTKDTISSSSTSSSSTETTTLASPSSSTPSTTTTTEVSTNASTRLDLEMQIGGNLWKKDTAGSNTWTERYFVLKDGYLLYYPDRKTPMTQMDMHPKGMLPLDGVDIGTERTGPSKSLQSGIRISHPSFGNRAMILCAHNDEERDKWVTALQNSRNVSFTSVATTTVQMEELKNKYTELSTKYEKNEKLLSKRLEQINQLVAQTRTLYRAIEKAEQKYNIKIEVSENNASSSSSSSSSSNDNFTPAPTILPPPSTFIHPASSIPPAFTLLSTPPMVVLPPPVTTTLPPPYIVDTTHAGNDNDTVHSNSSAGPSRHSSIFDSNSTTVEPTVSNTLPAFVTAPPRGPSTNVPTVSSVLPSTTNIRPPTIGGGTVVLPTTAVAPSRPNIVPAPVPASTTTVLPTTAMAPPRPGALPTTVTVPPNKPNTGGTSTPAVLPTVAVPPPRSEITVPVPSPAPAPVPLPVEETFPSVSANSSSTAAKITAPPNKPGKTKTAFGQVRN